jgi:hypothetical protein
VTLLTLGVLGLYALGTQRAFREVRRGGFVGAGDTIGVDPVDVAGAFLFGLSMFVTLFLGAVLAVFLTQAVVRGDAERGLLQPLVVRPIGRVVFLGGRLLGAVTASTIYVVVVFAAAVLITGAIGSWWPDRLVAPALQLAAAVAVVGALSLLGSVFLSSTANGIAVFMVFGAGLTAGLLGQIGEGIGSDTLQDVARAASWVLPFEALYQDALGAITEDTFGLTRLAIDLGPFGGAQSAGSWLWPWAFAYSAVVSGGAALAFARKDL